MKQPINTTNAPAAIGPYVQAVTTGKFIFTSGQLPLSPATGEFAGPDAASQARCCLENLSAVLTAGGAGLGRIIKTTIFLTDMSDFGQVNEVYASFFPGTPPARSCIAVAALPKGAKVEIEAIAYMD